MTKKKLLYAALGILTLLLLPSCVDTGYYSYSGSYSTGYYPGSSLTTLPHGYTRVYVGGIPYYHHGSRWYRRSGGRYIACARPHNYHGYHSSHRYTRPYSSYSYRHTPYSYRPGIYRHSSYPRSHYYHHNRYPSHNNRFHHGSRHHYRGTPSRNSPRYSTRPAPCPSESRGTRRSGLSSRAY